MKKHGTLHSFRDIDASRFAKNTGEQAPAKVPRRKEPVAEKTARIPAGPESLDETEIFQAAMDGVAPIRARGRELAPPARPAAAAGVEALAAMDALFNDTLEFSLEYSEEFIQGHVLGLDSLVLGKLRSGAYSPEGHLDLHGQNLEQAYAALSAFLKEGYATGKRHLLVITGRGKNSPGGTPILRERVQAWFTRDPFKRVLLAFCTAKPGDGGAGALYLLLRKHRKNRGKIVWDRSPSEEELLR
ncbi:MAG: Smr/MutS family protein [Deltaproteobacteria bacterium]|jgi:DNA-nicking Smr family endonuclease|nr:Smr/MutS family protein [Deltaproteobacteria bacterium]